MAPIRRYLRITKHSVLECRVYLDNPAEAQRWLLNSRDPVLPRVIESVRPLVLPKLREENERSKGKGKKNKGVKDVVIEDEFEVSIFLTELSTRHSLLTKQKIFKNEGGRLKSNSGKMTGTSEVPIEVQDDTTVPVMVREESDEQEGGLILKDIPAVEDVAESEQDRESRRKRRRRSSEDLFVSDSPGEGDFQSQQTPSKRNKRDGEHDTITGETGNVEEDKKKMGLSTAYDGFSIYGRILCLVVKRRGTVKGKQRAGAGQAKMEDWIASTQVDQSYED